MCRKMLCGWKSFYRNESARPDAAGRTISARLNSSRLSGNRTLNDAGAVAFRTDQKNGVRIHSVGGKVERRGRRERGCQRQGVWTSAWRSDGERAAELNIDELLPCSELVEIHDAAGVIPGGRGQLQLADKVLLVGAHSGPDEGKVSRQPGGSNGAGRLCTECSVAGELGVSFLENGLRRRDQVKNEGERSHLRIRPCSRAATQSVGIDGISPRDRAALRRKERYDSVVVFIEKNPGKIAGAIGGEAARGGNGPSRAAASEQKRKAAVQRGGSKGNILLRKGLSRECLRKIGAEQFQASGIDDVERKIVPGDTGGAAAKVGAVAVRIHLIERASWEKLLVGCRARYIGVKQTSTNTARAICVEAADDGFGILTSIDSGEVKNVSIGDGRIGESRRVLSLERATGGRVHIRLRNDALNRGGKSDAVVCRAGVVRQVECAAAIGGDGIRAVRELKRENASANVHVFKTTGNMAIAVRGEAAGPREGSAQPTAEFRSTHQESVLPLQARVGKGPCWRRGRWPDNRCAVAARGAERSKQYRGQRGEPLDVAVHRAPSCCWVFCNPKARAPAWERGAPFAVRRMRDCPPFWITRTRKTLPCRVAEFTPTTLTESPFAREKWFA